MYKIQKVSDIPTKSEVSSASVYPFDKLQPGEGFMVPNLDANPPDSLRASARTLQNMQTHCNHRNRRKKNAGKEFRAALKDDYWIQVWRVT